jgi:hypothetical protein
MALILSTTTLGTAVASDAPVFTSLTLSHATQTLDLINGRDGGDQIIITITQEVFRRKFNSGFQNS